MVEGRCAQKCTCFDSILLSRHDPELSSCWSQVHIKLMAAMAVSFYEQLFFILEVLLKMIEGITPLSDNVHNVYPEHR